MQGFIQVHSNPPFARHYTGVVVLLMGNNLALRFILFDSSHEILTGVLLLTVNLTQTFLLNSDLGPTKKIGADVPSSLMDEKLGTLIPFV